MRRSLVILSVLVGCGGDDAGTPIDAALPDALIDAPAPSVGHHHYVLDTISVPTTNNQARDDGFDLNGDQTVDNQFGMVLGTLSSMGFDVQATTTANIDHGRSITLVDLHATDFTTDPAATYAMFVGANPMPAACAGASDTACRHHLAGTATFTIPAGSPTNVPLAGALAAGTLTAGPGHLAAPLATFSTTAPVTVNLIGARVQAMTISGSKIVQLKIGGAIPQSELDAKVYPGMRDGMQASVAHDCTMLSSPPGCGCAAGSTGRSLIGLFDTNHDCQITADEVKNNSLIQSLFAPDVTIDNTMAVSFGFKATAIEAGFVAP